ncbi:transporter substrate-binding domain-containing protein [Ileibacterium valens]|uniref:transporter substrate-binding domain-containing protein n=1 Tax=Ileibacterium valens TaxID=1862668 RepID=UPI002729C8AC|nr:transporter substrate-binding domain-containing protein [Ileibacterium valens]
MKKLMTVLAAGSMALTLAACSNAGSNDAAGSEAPAEAKEILIGISPDYPPYESKNTAGEIEGFDVDMTKWLFDYLNENGYNYTYDFEELSFDTIISSLQAGQIDLGISGFTYDEDREGIFSDSYYDSAQVIVVKADSDIASSADLAGKKVGAQQGTTGETVAGTVDAADVQAISDAKVLMENLKADGIDAVIIDKAVADSYAANGEYKVLDEELLDEENLIYTTEDHKELLDQINTVIKAFKESDDYTKLTEKWFVASNE